jgi:hypothetical protein
MATAASDPKGVRARLLELAEQYEELVDDLAGQKTRRQG